MPSCHHAVKASQGQVKPSASSFIHILRPKTKPSLVAMHTVSVTTLAMMYWYLQVKCAIETCDIAFDSFQFHIIILLHIPFFFLLFCSTRVAQILQLIPTAAESLQWNKSHLHTVWHMDHITYIVFLRKTEKEFGVF